MLWGKGISELQEFPFISKFRIGFETQLIETTKCIPMVYDEMNESLYSGARPTSKRVCSQWEPASDITRAWTPYRKEFLTININIPRLSMKQGMRTIWIETRGEKDESL